MIKLFNNFNHCQVLGRLIAQIFFFLAGADAESFTLISTWVKPMVKKLCLQIWILFVYSEPYQTSIRFFFKLSLYLIYRLFLSFLFVNKCLPVKNLAQIAPKIHTSSCSSTIWLFCNGFLTGIPVKFKYINTWWL